MQRAASADRAKGANLGELLRGGFPVPPHTLGGRLTEAGVLAGPTDVTHLRFEELAAMPDGGALPPAEKERHRRRVLARAAKRSELEGRSATRTLVNGQTVVVDGTAGRVTVPIGKTPPDTGPIGWVGA